MVVELTSGRIGAKIEFVEQGIKVKEFARDSPAEEAGMELGDMVTAVDGVGLQGIRKGEIILRIQGPVGSKVLLTIIREGVDALIDMGVTLIDFGQIHY
jgi:carboxyl-terminal processing protease